MAKKDPKIIAMEAPVEIIAAEGDEPKGPAKFSVVAYTGGAMHLNGYDQPVVVDLNGMGFGKSLIANLDHDRTKRVGHVTEKSKADGKLTLGGIASASTEARREVVESSNDGFVWQASIEAMPEKIVEVDAGKTIEANGQEFTGPLYLVRKSTLSGFAFVSHGADDNTTVAIAAEADNAKEKNMKISAELKTFIGEHLPGVDAESLSEQAIANLQADFEGKQGKRTPPATDLSKALNAKKAEHDRVSSIVATAEKACDNHPFDIEAINLIAQQAIDEKWELDKFRLELLEATVAPSQSTLTVRRQDNRLSNDVLQAAICMAGRLDDLEKKFDERTLQAAEDRFPSGIGLKELFVLSAQANGYRGNVGYNVDLDVQRAAFGMTGPRSISAAGGFSTLSLSTILSNTANKFLREGWMHVDQTPMRVASVRPVRDFKQITTVSLTGNMIFEQIGPGGEIQHGTVGETTYTNKADTYGKMFAITRQDIINDDLSALTDVPRKIGRGGMLLLNHIFWTEFLDNSTFFASGNSNVSTGGGSALGLTGLQAAEKVFINQTDEDGFPVAVMPKILLVPPTLKATALTLMNSQLTITGASSTLPDGNIWRGRFDVESSPYMENSAYTGNSTAAWYLLADPRDIPVIEIVALNGRVEPTVETADADFNVLGVQMRGYSDVGVNLQEFRGGVRSAGS